jgi:hypothetical protein
MMRKSPKLALILIGLFLISLAGSLAIHYATYWGPWAYSDSTEYIATARSILAGRGLGYAAASGDFVLYSLHPPLYPLVLSALGLIGLDILVAARWLNILLFGLAIFLSGSISYAIFRSAWLAITMSIALSTIPVFVDVSSGAMSEPLYLLASILAFGLLVFYLARRKGILLVGSAILACMAALSRYVGIVVVIACVITLLVAGRINWKKRILDILTFCLASLAPLAAWLIWIYSQSRSLAMRTILLQSDLPTAVMALRKGMMEIFLSWLPFKELFRSYNYIIGRNYLFVLLIVIAALTILLILSRIFKRPASQDQSLGSTFIFLWALFSIGNILVLAYTFLFTTPTPDLNTRTLLPVQFGSTIYVITLLASVVHEFRLPQAMNVVCGLLILGFMYPNAQASWKLISQYHQFGLGYTNAAWHNSQTLQALNTMPSTTPLITNEATAVLLHLDRAAFDFCSPPCNPSSGIRYGDDLLDPVQKIFREQGAALVLFYPYCDAQNHPSSSYSLAQLNSLTRDLNQAFQSCDGAIYYYPAKQ